MHRFNSFAQRKAPEHTFYYNTCGILLSPVSCTLHGESPKRFFVFPFHPLAGQRTLPCRHPTHDELLGHGRGMFSKLYGLGRWNATYVFRWWLSPRSEPNA